ncbi:MAG: hypothetical protein ABI665_05575 [Vicinamibacterales bacterium]
MRTITAVALAVAALALVVTGAPEAVTAMRARAAVVSSCDDALAALAPGTWVRLRGCGVDMFHSSFLDDAEGRRLDRLVPLRASGQSVEAPSQLALAIPEALAADPNTYNAAPRPDSSTTEIAGLGETVAVVWDTLDRLPHHLVEVPGFDSGLSPSPALIEIRQVPSLRRSGWRAAAAFGLLLLAIVVARYKPSTRVGTAPVRAQRAAVRWGLVFVAVLIGMVGLWRVLGIYFDPMQQPAPTRAARPVPRPRPARAPPGVTPPRPTPTPQQIADLGSIDPVKQLSAANALLARAVTPDLVKAVESALNRKPDEKLESPLVCLKARFDGPEILEFLLARFPAEKKLLDWNLEPDTACVLDALVERAATAPERIRDALMPAIYASNYTSRSKALKAFRAMDLPQIPPVLVAEASTTGTPFQREATAAVIALGAVRLNPAFMEKTVRNYSTRAWVREELRTNPHPNAARIVAKASDDSDLFRLAMEREREQHDVSAALLEMVLDNAQPEAQRVFSAYQLGRLGETGPLTDLAALSRTLEVGKFKTTVEGAMHTLEELRRHNVKPRMRALAP